MRKAVLLLFALFAMQLFATSVIPMSVEQMTMAASHVVHARAISSEARWNADHTAIFTFTRFARIENWKGTTGAEFTVRQMGGRVGNIEQKVSGIRRWNSGDEAVLFLRPSEAGAGVMAVVGLFQGNFTVMRNGTTVTVSNGVPDASQFDPATRTTESYHAATFQLNELRRRVARVAGQ